MAVPLLEKTYIFSVNESHGGISMAQDHKDMLFAIKARLTGYASSPWVVHSSSNAVTAGLGDNWVSSADITWSNGGVRSWIVLTTPNGGQFLFDCSASFENRMAVSYSPTGAYDASLATTSVTPTATDEVSLIAGSQGYWFTSSTTGQIYRLHFIHSVDGHNSMVIGYHNGVNRLFIGSLKVLDSVAGWDYPYIATMTSDFLAGHMTYAKLHNQEAWYSHTKISAGINFAGALSCEGFNSNALGEEMVTTSYFTNAWPMAPVGFASSTPNARGRHGRIADLWLTSTSLNDGDTLEDNPLSPTREFAVFDHVVVPWNGSIPATT